MTGWVPIVSDIVDSSLWDEPDYVIKVFLSMLAKKDADFIVWGDIYTIAKHANKRDRIEEVLEAIRILESPDTKKPLVKQKFDGRRIEAVTGGWKILNGPKYQQLVSDFREKKRKREWAAKHRNSALLPGEASNEKMTELYGSEEAERLQQMKDQAQEGPP